MKKSSSSTAQGSRRFVAACVSQAVRPAGTPAATTNRDATVRERSRAASRWSPGVAGALLVAPILACLTGCGMQAGTLLYWMGAGRLHQVDAEFTLSEGPILILVDDLNERLTWAPARDRIAEELGKQLLEHETTRKIISPETVKRHRRTHADFDDLKCNQVGRLVGADQVLWIEVQAFRAEEEVHDTTLAASISVTVRVINPNERKNRNKVRLWPPNREGKPATVQLNSNEVGRLKTRANIAAELSRRLAKEVAKFFYKHPLQDPEE